MSVNDITGDPIRTGVPSDKYKKGWDAIFKKRIEGALAQESVPVPSGLQREELREFILKHAELTSCASHQDGDCCHKQCPQLLDNEPKASGRSCPLYNWSWGDND